MILMCELITESGNDNSRWLQIQAGHSCWSWRALRHRCQLWHQESFPTTGTQYKYNYNTDI